MFKVQTLSTISHVGLNELPDALYTVSHDVSSPDAILVRSHDMHNMLMPASLKVVGRAGAGLNNIPIRQLTKRGIPVLNTPGANANAVCELVIAGMLMARRHIPRALDFVKSLKDTQDEALTRMIENNKKNFVGKEIANEKLGVIGLGNVGVRVANAAVSLGMEVIGYDPKITVNRAWELSASVRQAHSIEALLTEADMVTFHVPLIDETKKLFNEKLLPAIKPGITVLNFARDEIIDHEAMLTALKESVVKKYVTDFPCNLLRNHPNVINLPHLGASTLEAEENCATMIARQIRAFLETGTIIHSANFPNVNLSVNVSASRLLIANDNVPNMVAQISSKLANRGINIQGLVNKSRDEVAYTVVDVQNSIPQQLLAELAELPGILQVRMINAATRQANMVNIHEAN